MRNLAMLGVLAAMLVACRTADTRAPSSQAPPAPPAKGPPAADGPPPAGKPTVGPRKLYVTTGHGEITSYDSVPPELKRRIPERQTSELRKQIGTLGYDLAELGVAELARDVPEDASIVFLLAPTVPLLPPEWDAFGRYLDRGGRMLIALDPVGEPGLGVLEGRLGLRFNGAHLTDDRKYVPVRQALTDRRFVITTEFSAHASVASLARAGNALLLIDSGALDEVPFTMRTPPTRAMTIRSFDSSWLDLDENFNFDDQTERRQRWSIGAAVEGPKGGNGRGFRALVFADVDLFADILVSSPTGGGPRPTLTSGPLLGDCVRWLAE